MLFRTDGLTLKKGMEFLHISRYELGTRDSGFGTRD